MDRQRIAVVSHSYLESATPKTLVYLARQHCYMCDFNLPARPLVGFGFRSVERCAYRGGLVPDLHRMDNHPEETLYVECTK